MEFNNPAVWNLYGQYIEMMMFIALIVIIAETINEWEAKKEEGKIKGPIHIQFAKIR